MLLEKHTAPFRTPLVEKRTLSRNRLAEHQYPRKWMNGQKCAFLPMMANMESASWRHGDDGWRCMTTHHKLVVPAAHSLTPYITRKRESSFSSPNWLRIKTIRSSITTTTRTTRRRMLLWTPASERTPIFFCLLSPCLVSRSTSYSFVGRYV